MENEIFLTSLFLIFAGAAIFSTMALYSRQSLLVGYMLLGIFLGPFGLKWVSDPKTIEQIGSIGIVFLLFLLGLDLQPQSMLHVLKKITLVAIISSLIFAATGFTVSLLFHFSFVESVVIGAAMMFSSTIIGLKLLPTSVLHHQHIGEMMVGILLLQDLLAIFTLIVTQSATAGEFNWANLGLVLLFLPLLILFAFVSARFVLIPLFRRFNRIREYMFLLAIAWCLSLSELAHYLGLSREIGAFIAGVSIASSPIATYIAESLKPIRDFFLVLFFFAIGGGFNLHYFSSVAIPAIIMAALLLVIKPISFALLLRNAHETKKSAWEVGVRLGQTSEFSLLLAYVGIQEAVISTAAFSLIQLVTILTFVVSSYWVVLRYPTPVALSDKLRRD